MAYKEKDTKKWLAQWFETTAKGVLVEKLKEVVKNLTIKCVQLTEQSDIIDRLQEKAVDLGRLERYLGREQIRSIVESKALEQAERANKRLKRAFEMSR